ncbi:MAG: hypothetical protein WD601_13565, partial [Pseudohongiellaceae bacterium]
IGGTGKFGGESGMGGTGGPAMNFGATDSNEDERQQQQFAYGGSLPQGIMGMTDKRSGFAAHNADVYVDVRTLKLTPEMIRPSSRLKEVSAELDNIQRELDASLRQETDQSRIASLQDPITVEQVTSDALVTRHNAISDAGNDMLINSMEITRQLLLAEAASITGDIQTDVPLELHQEGKAEPLDEDMRRRLSVPARPERPDRPSVPRRASPSQRGIPAPPVRPLRI